MVKIPNSRDYYDYVLISMICVQVPLPQRTHKRKSRPLAIEGRAKHLPAVGRQRKGAFFENRVSSNIEPFRALGLGKESDARLEFSTRVPSLGTSLIKSYLSGKHRIGKFLGGFLSRDKYDDCSIADLLLTLRIRSRQCGGISASTRESKGIDMREEVD